jgi:glycolate oxidase FAD binding subunit
VTIDQLAEQVANATKVQVEEDLNLSQFNQIISFMPSDQLVEVQAGILLCDLNSTLRESGFEIPFGWPEDQQNRTVADLLSFNYPHLLSPQVGSWRDWVVRMTIILASGEVVKSGANVVKNVTGFDLHKLIIGARFSLGIPIQVTLRIRPYAGPNGFATVNEPAPPTGGISEIEQKLMKRTKEIFDPTNKLNPGVFGFL